MKTTEKDTLKTIRFTAIEARLLEESAKAHNLSVSDVVRSAVILWREHVGDRRGAIEQWVSHLIAEHGETAMLTARVNDEFSLDIEIDGREMDDFVAEAVFDRRDQVQLWVGDPDTDARVYLGRVRQLVGAAITVPIASLSSVLVPQTPMQSDEHQTRRGCAEAHVARAWEEVRMMRDARCRKNAWCLMGLVIVLSAGLSGEPLAVHRLVHVLLR